MANAALYILIFIALAGAVGVAVIQNVLHAALLLILSLVAIAGVYAILLAEFIAVAQIMIYAGGVVVLIIFGIMITIRTTGTKPLAGKQFTLPALLVTLALAAFLVTAIQQADVPVLDEKPTSALKPIGAELITTYALPFEIAGILLLVSLIGAAVTASYKKSNE